MKHILKYQYDKMIKNARNDEGSQDKKGLESGVVKNMCFHLRKDLYHAHVFWIDEEVFADVNGYSLFKPPEDTKVHLEPPEHLPFSNVIVNVPAREYGVVFSLHCYDMGEGYVGEGYDDEGDFAGSMLVWNFTSFLLSGKIDNGFHPLIVAFNSLVELPFLFQFHKEEDDDTIEIRQNFGAYVSQSVFKLFSSLETAAVETKPVTVTNREIRPGVVGDAHKYQRISLAPKKVCGSGVARDYQPRRKHEVRGHWRKYKSGAQVWVPAHSRGNASLGTVEKTYIIEREG
jgi:hypothetical protein